MAQRPIDDRGTGWKRGRAIALDGLRPDAEVILVKTPGDCAVVDRSASCSVAIGLCRKRRRPGVCIRPPGDGLPLDIRSQILALEVAQLILRAEVGSGQPWPALKGNDLHPRLAELGREDPAGCAGADNHHIGFFGCHGSAPACRGLRLQADQYSARERLPAREICRCERRMRAGKPH
jgi:hypothetical protein